MYLVNIKEHTYQECDVLAKRQGYGYILLVENTILCLPVEEENYYLCSSKEEAEMRTYPSVDWFVCQ